MVKSLLDALDFPKFLLGALALSADFELCAARLLSGMVDILRGSPLDCCRAELEKVCVKLLDTSMQTF